MSDVKVSVEGGHGDVCEGQQLVTVKTLDDEQQVIMVAINHANGAGEQIVTTQSGSQVILNVKTDGAQVVEETVIASEDILDDGLRRNSATQTETVFGLEDLPTVKEIVKKTLARAKLRDAEVIQPTPTNYGPLNGIYTCNICGKVYRNKISWQNHLVSHGGQEVYMCGVCGQLFNVRLNLKAHLDIHTREEKKLKRQRSSFGTAEMKIGGVFMPGDVVPRDEITPTRTAGLTDNSELGANEEVMEHDHDADIPDMFLQSDLGVSSSKGPARTAGTRKTETVEPETENYIYACNICGEQYTVKEDCENHLKVHTDGLEVPSEPPKPPKPQNTPPSLVIPPSNDIKDVSTPMPRSKFSAYIYACNVCGKQYTNKSNCKRHMRIHTDEEKVFECEYCGKRFSQKYEVKMHARIHTGEKPFSCAVCGKTFTERGNWRRHTQIHVRPQEASPYRCGICCKGFFHAEKLQVHLQIHSGQRPFICTVCGRRVKKIGDMYRHLRTHTGEKPYKCQVCGKGFAQNGNLKDHMKMHTGEKPHICDLCGKDFARKVLLKDHIKNHHKGTTLQDLTEAALEEIERQEAAMEGLDGTQVVEGSVIQEIAQGNVPKILSTTSLGKTIVMDGPSNQNPDEEQLLNEEHELELHDVHTTLTEKELEAAHVLTVVQDGDNTIYAYKMEPEQEQQQIVVTTEPSEQSDPQTEIIQVSMEEQSDDDGDIKPLTMIDSSELEVQNS